VANFLSNFSISFVQINSGAGRKFFAQLAEAGFGPGFQQPELIISQSHIGANLLLGLLEDVKAVENIPVAAGDAVQHLPRDVDSLTRHEAVFGVVPPVGHRKERVLEIHTASALVYGHVDGRRNLTLHYGSYVPHKPFRLTEIAVADGLRDDQETIVDFVVELVRTQVAQQKIANAFGKTSYNSSIAAGSPFRILSTSRVQSGPGRVPDLLSSEAASCSTAIACALSNVTDMTPYSRPTRK
jgi:hypothetical protein